MANLSKIKRDRMLAFLDKIREVHKDDDEVLVSINEVENEILNKRYGLVWEEHSEEVDERMLNEIPVFAEDKDKEISIIDDKYNFILEGDNLHSLHLLEKTHKEKIDVIYIDPPYNTGFKDFIYDDAFVDKQDGFRHSKWLSFMSKRLKIAERLLSDKGTIFISIDDNEEAPLRMLCDDIFGEDKFVANISWQRTYSPRNDSQGLSSEVEHILLYSKNIEWQPSKLQRTEKMDSIYKSPDGDEKPWTSSSLTAPSASSHQGMVYAIQHPFTGEMMYPTSGRCWALGQDLMLENMNKWAKYKYQVLDDATKRAEICGLSPDSLKAKDVPAIVLDEPLDDARRHAEEVMNGGVWPYFYFTNKGKGGLRRKTYLSDLSGRMPTNFWAFSEVGHTDGAKKELKNIFGGKIPFDTPKPTSLIRRILEIASRKDSIILDFFAGSGTTGQAVLELNKEDGGNRHFILCTNNENNICEGVTYPRMKTIITGMREDGNRYSDGIASNLKYYRTDYIPKESGALVDDLLKNIDELIQLEYGVKIDKEQYISILSDEDADELQNNWSNYPNIKAIYISRRVLLTSAQRDLFSTKDCFVIPDYYYRNELKEVGEL